MNIIERTETTTTIIVSRALRQKKNKKVVTNGNILWLKKLIYQVFIFLDTIVDPGFLLGVFYTSALIFIAISIQRMYHPNAPHKQPGLPLQTNAAVVKSENQEAAVRLESVLKRLQKLDEILDKYRAEIRAHRMMKTVTSEQKTYWEWLSSLIDYLPSLLFPQ